jgi:hypothetical protein
MSVACGIGYEITSTPCSKTVKTHSEHPPTANSMRCEVMRVIELDSGTSDDNDEFLETRVGIKM